MKLMPKLPLILGLLVSALVHTLLFGWRGADPTAPTVPTAAPAMLPVVETDLARLRAPARDTSDDVDDAELDDTPPAPEPKPAPDPEPEPEPELQSEPEPEPQPETEPEPAPMPDPEPVAPARSEPLPSAPSPQPPLVETATPGPAGAAKGDLAGDPDGTRQPTLRIDWGSPARALAILESGGMQVVLLDLHGGAPIITHELARDAEGWRLRDYQPPAGSTRFSNHLRVVDGVPAFRALRDAARPTGHQRLAVLVPVGVEQMLEAAQIRAAFERGLSTGEIDSYAGRFRLEQDGLSFEIVHVGVIQ